MSMWTQADIDYLKKQIASGASSLRYKDRDITLRSLPEMKELLADMIEDVHGKKRRRRTNPRYDSGL